MLKSRHKIPLSEQLKNPIGKSYIGNLDTPSTHIHDHSLIDGENKILITETPYYAIFYIVQYKSAKIPHDVIRSRNSKIMTLQKHQS
jgi:hypothetical protein